MTSLSSTETRPLRTGTPRLAPAAGAPSLPPGPRLPFPVQSFLFWQQLVPFLSRAQRRYGDVFTLRMLPWAKAVVVADPELVKEIVTGPPEVFRAGEANRNVPEVLGTKASWWSTRRSTSPRASACCRRCTESRCAPMRS